MKKSILITIVMLLILSVATSVNAYSTSDYSIDVPDTFKKVTSAAYSKEDGSSFNIQVTPYNEKEGDPYNQRTLDKLVDELAKGISNFKFNSADVKEITKCTKNNYKCFHVLSNFSMGYNNFYCDQYAIVSGNKIYTLTLGSFDKEDFNKDEMKGIIDSFTIKNYKEPKSQMSPTLITAIIGAGVGALLGLVSVIKNKKENAKVNVAQNVVETEKVEEKVEENSNISEKEEVSNEENKDENKE